jgi:hypothetical protein
MFVEPEKYECLPRMRGSPIEGLVCGPVPASKQRWPILQKQLGTEMSVRSALIGERMINIAASLNCLGRVAETH